MNMELAAFSTKPRDIDAFGTSLLGRRDKALHARSTLATISSTVKDGIVLQRESPDRSRRTRAH